MCTDDGRQVQLHATDAGGDRLEYGYATTIHRAQGATTQRAHLFADGGGRELAYVALSRAPRESTHVWTVADDLLQAADDLRRDWSTRRTPTWAIDTALPDLGALNKEHFDALPSHQQAHFAALLHAEKAIAGAAVTGIRLPDRTATLGQAEQAFEAAQHARVDLETGSGVWTGTEAGRAVRELTEARANRHRADWTAEHGARWRDRHAGRKEAAEWTRREADAEERCTAHMAPEIARLDQEVTRHQAILDHIAGGLKRREAATQAVIRDGLEQRRQASGLAGRITAERDHLDGVPSAADIRRAALRREQLRSVGLTPQHEPPAPKAAGIEM